MARKLGTLGRIGITAAFIAVAGPAAAVPPFLSEQGRLFDNTGVAVDAPGGMNMKFTLYADSATTTALWTSTQSITIEDGYFSAVLGDTSNGGTALPPGLFDGTTLYLGVKLGTDAEMTPRQPIVSVPYALVAQRVLDKLGNVVVDDNGVWQGSPTGLKGATGAAGPTGPSGAPGGAGPTGPSGTPGGAGPTGPSGTPGGAGPTGPSGTPGGAGPTGPSGAPGSPGTPGGAGPTGPSGPAGPTGPKGATGPSGVTFTSDGLDSVTASTSAGTVFGTNVTPAYVAAAGDVALVWMTGYCTTPTTGTGWTEGFAAMSINGGAYSIDFAAFGIGGPTSGGYVPIGQSRRYPLSAGTSYSWVTAFRTSMTPAQSCSGGIVVQIVH